MWIKQIVFRIMNYKRLHVDEELMLIMMFAFFFLALYVYYNTRVDNDYSNSFLIIIFGGAN